MNNQIFSRLCNLMQGLGFNMQAGDITKAEMRAYAAGLSMVDELIEKALRNAFIDTADDYGLSMLLSLTRLSPAETDEETRHRIVDSFSEGYYYTSISGITTRFFQNDHGFVSSYPDRRIILYYYGDSNNKKRFAKLEKIIDECLPAYMRVKNASGDLNFDSFDAFELTWFDIDEANLPFYGWDMVFGYESNN